MHKPVQMLYNYHKVNSTLELLRAIATETGIPNKGNKSLVTSSYRNRYKDNVFIDTFSTGWLPDIVILEGMFLINTMPLRIHSKICDT